MATTEGLDVEKSTRLIPLKVKIAAVVPLKALNRAAHAMALALGRLPRRRIITGGWRTDSSAMLRVP